MAIINFPSNASTGTIYTFEGRSWIWNGRAWQTKSTFVGYTGSQGDAGFLGSTGYTGSRGEQGYTGSAAADGTDGYTGSIGYTGSRGGGEFVFRTTGSNYIVDGFAGNYPTLTVVRGQLYYFDLSNVTSGDPLTLRLSSLSTATVAGTQGNDPINGAYGTGTVITYQVPYNAPGSIIYQCTVHSEITGVINIVDQVGYTGSIGYTGSQGTAGTDGYVGSQGETGFTGSTGYTGSVGAAGYTGSQGLQGPSGEGGAAGNTGYTGSIGYTGSKGDMGYTGPIGYTGSAGTNGTQGAQGFTGSKGEKGDPGDGGAGGATVLERHYKKPGILTVNPGTEKWYLPLDSTITSMIARVEVAPLGTQGVGVRVNVNSNSTATLTINTSTTVSSLNTSTINVRANDYITVDVINIGNTNAGSDLTVTFTYIRNI